MMTGLGRLQDQDNRLRLPENTTITITFIVNHDHDYNHDYNVYNANKKASLHQYSLSYNTDINMLQCLHVAL